MEEKHLPEDITLAWSQFLQSEADLTREVQYSIWTEVGWPVDQRRRDVVEIWADASGETAVLALREDGSWWKIECFCAYFGYRLEVLSDRARRIEAPEVDGCIRVWQR